MLPSEICCGKKVNILKINYIKCLNGKDSPECPAVGRKVTQEIAGASIMEGAVQIEWSVILGAGA